MPTSAFTRSAVPCLHIRYSMRLPVQTWLEVAFAGHPHCVAVDSDRGVVTSTPFLDFAHCAVRIEFILFFSWATFSLGHAQSAQIAHC
jgi:hypothetical protein